MIAADKNAPTWQGRGANSVQNHGLGLPQHATATPIDALLPRLHTCRQFGKGWRADCPTGHKSHGTLAITEAETGNVLLHCFAGCSASDILAAIGLELADLYPVRIKPQTPEQQREQRQTFMQAGWAAAIGVLSREATIVQIAAIAIARGELLDDGDIARVKMASDRIYDVRAVLT
jgi:hypothetical protein